MAHKEQKTFCLGVKDKFPNNFKGIKVLDIGSFDCNGNDKHFFEECEYTGIDLTEGENVDVVCAGQDYDAPDETFDTIISCECFEHNPFWKETLENALRMLKTGGLLLFTCATTGRPVHGVASENKIMKDKDPNWKTLPNVLIERDDWDTEYYKNLTEQDIRSIFDMQEVFTDYHFEVEVDHCDLYFWGIKK
jgi:SAM-dependent methyltransferase